MRRNMTDLHLALPLTRLTPGGGGARLEHNMNKQAKLADLRHSLAHYGLPPERPVLPLGVEGADAALGGGLATGALHEVHAGDWGAAGFAACLAIRAAGRMPFFWVRPDYEALEYGEISPMGLLELGGDPSRMILVRTAQASEALAAAADIVAVAAVGALVLELSRNPKSLDLVASRKLAFAAATSGVTVFLLREGAREMPSAATTRWQVRTAPASDAEEWGRPSFAATLTRNRLGLTGGWTMQWDPNHGLFREPRRHAPHSVALAEAAFHRPHHPARAVGG